jgi:phenylacetyl-CoA:acceptor oxidoreductase 27-kDa subunit
MTRWAMVIDLRKCIGCEICGHVCLEMNMSPAGGKWRRVIDIGLAESSLFRVFLPLSCMHCEKPWCLDVCPSGATRKNPDGIVDVEFSKCVGCGACVVACPYGARNICAQDVILSSGNDPIGLKAPPDVNQKDRIGISSKCHFCRPVVESGIAIGLQPGIDPEATPYCVRHCLGEALHFGDLDDADSEVIRLIKENKTVRLNEDLGTQPSVYYIVNF